MCKGGARAGRPHGCVQSHLRDNSAPGSLHVPAVCPCGQHPWPPTPASIGDGVWGATPVCPRARYRGVMVAPGQPCHGPGCLFGSIPPPHAAPPQVKAEWGRSHCGDGSWEEHPVLGAQQDGDPSRVAACPPVLAHRSGWWGCFLQSGSPGATHPGCTSGAQLLSCLSPPGPQHLGLWAPVAPTGTTPGQPPAPCLNPRGLGWVRGLLGLQMVARSQRLAQAPGDRGCHARGGASGGDISQLRQMERD